MNDCSSKWATCERAGGAYLISILHRSGRQPRLWHPRRGTISACAAAATAAPPPCSCSPAGLPLLDDQSAPANCLGGPAPQMGPVWMPRRGSTKSMAAGLVGRVRQQGTT